MTSNKSSANGRHYGNILCFVMALLLMGSLTACGSSDTSTTPAETNTAVDTASSAESSEAAESPELSMDEKTALERKEALDEFISYYNATATNKFEIEEEFDADDKESSHYESEFRLSAFDFSKGAFGHVGNVAVTFVSYRDGVRMYAEGEKADHDSMVAVFRDALHVYAPEASDEIIEQEIAAYVNPESSHQYSLSSLSDVDTDLNGYINASELMIENMNLEA